MTQQQRQKRPLRKPANAVAPINHRTWHDSAALEGTSSQLERSQETSKRTTICLFVKIIKQRKRGNKRKIKYFPCHLICVINDERSETVQRNEKTQKFRELAQTKRISCGAANERELLCSIFLSYFLSSVLVFLVFRSNFYYPLRCLYIFFLYLKIRKSLYLNDNEISVAFIPIKLA